MSGEVGYGRPPVATRFAKGQSGNKGGKRRLPSPNAMRALLTDPIKVTINGRVRKVSPSELQMNTLFEKAMVGDMVAAKAVIRACAAAGMYDTPESLPYRFITVPKDWDWNEWNEMYKLHGLPPWKGPRDGLVPVERRAALHRQIAHD